MGIFDNGGFGATAGPVNPSMGGVASQPYSPPPGTSYSPPPGAPYGPLPQGSDGMQPTHGMGSMVGMPTSWLSGGPMQGGPMQRPIDQIAPNDPNLGKVPNANGGYGPPATGGMGTGLAGLIGNIRPGAPGQFAQRMGQMQPGTMNALRNIPPEALQQLHQSGMIHPELMQHLRDGNDFADPRGRMMGGGMPQPGMGGPERMWGGGSMMGGPGGMGGGPMGGRGGGMGGYGGWNGGEMPQVRGLLPAGQPQPGMMGGISRFLGGGMGGGMGGGGMVDPGYAAGPIQGGAPMTQQQMQAMPRGMMGV